MGLPDYLSRAPVADVNLSEDGERDSHKLKVEDIQRQVLCSPVEATDRFTHVHCDPWSCDMTEQFEPRTARVEAVSGGSSTYHVFSLLGHWVSTNGS
jgi:hypothetical protein